MNTGHKLNNNDILAFILGGRARFTFKSLQTNADFSFEIKNQKVKKDGKTVENPDLKFVSLFIGANQAVKGRAYAYFGYITRTSNGWDYRFSRKSAKLSEDNAGVQAFNFVFNRLVNGVKLPTLEVWHEGFCSCCGRPLKLAESIEMGWGPVCMKNRERMLDQLRIDVEERRKEANRIFQKSPKVNNNVSGDVRLVCSNSFSAQGNLFNKMPDYPKK